MAAGMPTDAVSHRPVIGMTGFSRARLLQRAGIALCLALLIGLVASYIMLLHSGGAGPKKTDFVPYFSAAHLVETGQGDAIYSFHQLGQFEASLVRPLRVKDGVMPYLYPPYFALLLAPLASLPYTVAYLLWTILNVALLGLSILALQRYAGLRGAAALFFWAGALSFLPVLVGLAQGQTSIVLLAVFTGACLALRAGRSVPAGCLLACVLIKPTYVLPLLAVLLLRRSWRAVAACAASAIVLLAAPVLLLGASVNTGYGNTLLEASGWRKQIGGFQAQWNHSISGLVQLLLPGRAATMLALVLCLVILGLFLVAVARTHELDVSFALAIVVGLLVSPHVLVHDLTLLLIPTAIALRLRPEADHILPWLLGAGYCAVVAGLAIVTLVPVQLSVLVMSGFFVWALRRLAVVDTRGRGDAPGSTIIRTKEPIHAG
jgi:hypothetical protein